MHRTTGRRNAKSRPASTPDGLGFVSWTATTPEIDEIALWRNSAVPPIIAKHWLRRDEMGVAA